jgi:hypothetical protein
VVTVKLLVREHKRDFMTHVRYLYTTSRSARRRPAWPEIENLQVTSGPYNSSSLGLQGYLTIFTINNVVRELIRSLT